MTLVMLYLRHNFAEAWRVRRYWKRNGYEHAPCLFCVHDIDSEDYPIWLACLRDCDWGNT